MKRSPLKRRTRLKPYRSTPRRRDAPRWSWEEWETANQVLAARSGGVCERCGHSSPFMERHHRKRRRDGGDSLANVVLLCGGPGGCHAHITGHPKEARQFGWIVSVTRDPETVPMLNAAKEWVYLSETYTPAFDVVDAHE